MMVGVTRCGEKLIRWDEIFDSEGMKHAALEAPTEKIVRFKDTQ